MNVMVIYTLYICIYTFYELLLRQTFLASLIPLYNHEAKISLFIQIAMTREGSALLLSNDIMNSIVNCKFFNMSYNRSKPLGIIICSYPPIANY